MSLFKTIQNVDHTINRKQIRFINHILSILFYAISFLNFVAVAAILMVLLIHSVTKYNEKKMRCFCFVM